MIKRIRLNPKTPFHGLFSADQIWGQFIWAISDMYGEEKAAETVNLYSEGKAPVLFSSCMLDGYLIKPTFASYLVDLSNEIAKKNKKCNWLSYSDFESFQKNWEYLENKELDLSPDKFLKNIGEIHVSIPRDRRVDADSDSRLYNSSYTFSDVPLIVYVDIINDETWTEVLNELVKYWSLYGLGGDKNVGRGQFSVCIDDLSDQEKRILDYKSSNKYISISESFGRDLKPIYYSVEVYSGFIGRKSNSNESYRKKPIVRYLPGSLFLEGKGSVLKSMGENRSVFSYGLVFPIYVCLGDES